MLHMSELAKISDDDRLIEMWLHGRPDTTQASYRRTVRAFQGVVNKPLQDVTLEDLQRYATSLDGLKESSRRTKLNSIKSLFTFAAKLQYVRFNVAAALRLPKAKTTLAGRILTRNQVKQLLDAGSSRDRAFLRLLYGTGIRVSEACGLCWSDFHLRDDGSVQVRVLGKGNKERVVIVPGSVWSELAPLQRDQPETASVFGFDRTTAHRIVKASAQRAGLPKVSAHWFRHAHAAHSLAGGAPLQLVRDTLGHSSIAVTNAYLESNPDDSSSKYLGL
jgi:integrase/recombinase XerD